MPVGSDSSQHDFVFRDKNAFPSSVERAPVLENKGRGAIIIIIMLTIRKEHREGQIL